MPTKNVLTHFATCYILTTKELYSDPYMQFVNYYANPFYNPCSKIFDLDL